MSWFLIPIWCYLEAEIGYKPFILICRVVVQNYTQKVSSWFYQNWRRDGNFCDFPIMLWKRGRRPPEQPNGPWGPKEPPSPPQELEGGPKLLVSQYFLAPIGVLPRLFLHIGDFVRILMLHFPKSTIKNIFFGNPKTYKFSRLIILYLHVFWFQKKKFWAYFLESVTLAIFFNKSKRVNLCHFFTIRQLFNP